MFRVFLFLAALTCAAQDAAILMEGGVFRVAGWPAAQPRVAGWESLFAVYAGEGDVPPLLGTYSVEAGTLAFRPRYPLTPGMRVRAVFRPLSLETKFDIPKALPRAATTRVTEVYPTASLIPENQLKFYIYFSAPVQRGEAWTRIHLLREDGSRVDLPFLEIDHELWDRDNQRLTVLFDPGRIKRGVLPLKDVGPAIETGKSYTLVIDRDWIDGNGVPLVEPFRKSFRVGPADREPIDVAKWKITAPKAGTSEPLILEFPEPLDYALLQHFLQVPGAAGAVSVSHREQQWRFTPLQPWKEAEYRIVVQTTLEDLAGNRVGRPFDVDVFDKVTKTITSESVSLAFRPRK